MKKLLLLGAALPALALAGCGEGWEMKRYDGFPYNNMRTAGSGVEYVRANLMPKRGTVIDIMEPLDDVYYDPPPEQIIEAPADDLVQDADEIFEERQRK